MNRRAVLLAGVAATALLGWLSGISLAATDLDRITTLPRLANMSRNPLVAVQSPGDPYARAIGFWQAVETVIKGTAENALTGYQPICSDLTDICDLTTTAFGIGALESADAAAFRTYIGAGTGGGSVTSVDGSGGTTGLTLTGGPITATGTLTLGGTLAVANGGTGSTTASDARTALGLGPLTAGRVVLAGTGGALTDSDTFTYDLTAGAHHLDIGDATNVATGSSVGGVTQIGNGLSATAVGALDQVVQIGASHALALTDAGSLADITMIGEHTFVSDTNAVQGYGVLFNGGGQDIHVDGGRGWFVAATDGGSAQFLDDMSESFLVGGGNSVSNLAGASQMGILGYANTISDASNVSVFGRSNTAGHDGVTMVGRGMTSTAADEAWFGYSLGNLFLVGSPRFPNLTSNGFVTTSGGAGALSIDTTTYLASSAIGTTVQAYDADLTTWAGITPGTGVGTALAVNVGTAGAFVVNGGALGTPSSGVATNLTGTATGLTAGAATNASNGVLTAAGADPSMYLCLFNSGSGTRPFEVSNNAQFDNSTGALKVTALGAVAAGVSSVFFDESGAGTQTVEVLAPVLAADIQLTLPASAGTFARVEDKLSAFAATTSAELAGVLSDDAFLLSDVELGALAGLTSAANKIPRFTGSGTADLLDFKDEDNMASDSATALPSQQSVKAYVDSHGRMQFGVSPTGNFSTTKNFYHPSTGTTATTSGLASFRVGAAFTITALEAEISSGSDAGSGTITIKVENVTDATDLTVTIAEGSTTVGSTTGTLACGNGDRISFSIVTATGATGALRNIRMTAWGDYD